MCHQLKPESDFAFRSIATGERQGHCRVCHAGYRRQHYLDNREIYIRREVARMKAYRIDNRQRLLAYLLTHPCVDCGEHDPVVLDFDHRDRATKRSEVVKLATNKAWHQVAAEIEKCEVRCATCHRRRTARQLGWRRVWMTEADATILMHVDRASDPKVGIAPTSDRVCSTCRLAQPSTEFAIKNLTTGRRSTKCKSCQREYARAHYVQHRQKYIDKARRRNGADRDRFAAMLLLYFTDHPCVDCGSTDREVLEFDHRDGTVKLAAVSELIRGSKWHAARAEIAKCDVRCPNCHRRRTAEQFGWARRQLSEDPFAA